MPNSVIRWAPDERAGRESGNTTATSRVRETEPPSPRFGRFWAQYDQPERKWQIEILTQLFRLLPMPEGWDGYGAPAIKRDAGMFALEVLNSVMRPRTPLPQVVPTSVGGIQVEWHEKNIDLELHFTAPYECEMWFRDRLAKGPPVSLELTDDFSAVTGPIGELTSR